MTALRAGCRATKLPRISLPCVAIEAKLRIVSSEKGASTDGRLGVEDTLWLQQIEAALGERFEILGLLGKGGAGRVYRVRNRRLDRLEALKELTETADDRSPFARRFTQEARLAASLKHPNLVSVFDSGDTGGVLWFTMELVDGPSLADVLGASATLTPEDAVAVALPILDALSFIHESGIVHRDIKPSNIMLDESGTPRLTDFGVAKVADGARKTATGVLLGTPAYLAPEQFLGGQVDGRTDVYALGVTLYELLTGTLPFAGENALQIMVTRLSKNPEPVSARRPDLDRTLAAAITRALERDPAERFGSAGEMKAELLRWWEREPRDVSLRALAARGTAGVRRTSGKLVPPTVVVGAAERLPGPRRLIVAGAVSLPLLVAAAFFGPRLWRASAPYGVPPREQAPSGAMAAAVVSSVPSPVIPSAPTPRPTASALAREPAPSTSALPGVPPTQPPATQPPPRRPVTLPVELRRSAPFVPAELAEKCAGQEVLLALVVAEDGSVRRSRVLHAAIPECGEVAATAARTFGYRPALDASGAAVETTISIAMTLGAPEDAVTPLPGGASP